MKYLAILALLLGLTTATATAGGYVKGKQQGSCYFVPSSTVEGSTVTVYATGLPPNSSEVLFVLNYEVPTHTYTVTTDANGDYSGQYVIQGDKWTTFQFSSPSTNASRLTQNDATCKIFAASA